MPRSAAGRWPQAARRLGAIRLATWRWAFAACAACVLVLSLVPADTPMPGTGWDKSNHLLAFCVLALLGGRAYPDHRAVGVLPGLLAYGVLIEVLQSFTPTRSAEWSDVLADALGVLLGWGMLAALEHLAARRA